MAPRRHWKGLTVAFIAVILVLGGAGAALAWWKFFKPGEQDLPGPTSRFSYGSLDGELVAGLPYPIFMILPRVFPDLVAKFATEGYGQNKPGFGGYGAFGLAWQEGQRCRSG